MCSHVDGNSYFVHSNAYCTISILHKIEDNLAMYVLQ